MEDRPQINIANVVEWAKKQAEGSGYVSQEELARRQAEVLYGGAPGWKE